MDFFLQLALNGLLLGGFYATMALGFSTIWGVMRLINLAHGELLLLAAYVSWYMFNPTREQGLTISPLDVESNAGLFTFVILAVIFLIIGAIISEAVLDRNRFSNDALRRTGSIGGAVALAAVLFFIWNANALVPVTIPFSLMVVVGFALSAGFFVSHVVMGMWLDVGESLARIGGGYAAGALITAVLYGIWNSAGLPPLDPFATLPIVFILFFGFGYALQRGFFNRLVEGPYLTMLLVTFAVAIMLQSIQLQIFAADPRKTNVDYGTAF